MFEFEVNDAVILMTQKSLAAALSTNPKMQHLLRKIIRKYVLEARKQVVNGIQFEHGDPREARQAVRTSVYKKVFGANINIFSGGKAHGTNSYTEPRKGSHGRGGNRRKRTTIDRGKYAPLDRGFILRWLNNGVGDRSIKNFKTDRRRDDWPSVPKWSKHPNTGYRGNIAARHFFRPLADRALGSMIYNLVRDIEAEIKKTLEGK